ncbi:hypothetical protein Poli38472_006007 [Pythium oligandrum]|uniref:Actin-like protein n=1 Tax=Pythium oligandrum TaxID=41045 RepID=A0A8K1CSQ5_PYTOL|nr:hypothetical protein Poli38472_006007 [Pythium oligandrum]|eukprot:TMW68539.1 hypothetical protein Poli38472_006007 [Pythium oligandrum]
MYCGDDVEAVVGDVGTRLSKFGLAGEDTPSLVTPSVVGHKTVKAEDPSVSPYLVGDLFAARNVEVLRPMDACAVANWDAMEKIWKHAFENLHVDSKEHPVITSTPACFASDALANAAATDAEKYMEMMFEKFDVPCFYMAKDAVLDAFAFGRSSALIAEIGAGATRVVPVFDGYPLQRPAQHSTIGGDQLSEYLVQLVSQKTPAPEIRPRCCFTRKVNQHGKLDTALLPTELITPPTMPTSYLQYMTSEVYRDMRETVCRASVTSLSEDKLQQLGAADEQRYELPDGQVLVLGRERYQVGECLLQPELLETTKSESTAALKGLHRMLYDAVQLCDADIRRDMLSNIILCGGGSLLPGLTERLHNELSALVPSTYKVRFTSVMKIERQFSCFIGGSILASLGSFQQLWVSRREYDEVGASRLCADRFL